MLNPIDYRKLSLHTTKRKIRTSQQLITIKKKRNFVVNMKGNYEFRNSKFVCWINHKIRKQARCQVKQGAADWRERRKR